MQKLSQRYYDSKMNAVYSLEQLRAQYALDSNPSSFEEWIQDLVENEILIPIE